LNVRSIIDGTGGDDDDGEGQQQLPPPAIIFFNPGFSCSDFDWSSNALSFAQQDGINQMHPSLLLPMLKRTALQKLSVWLMGICRFDDDDEQDKHFFCENAYVGLRVHQSGTMANDLYVIKRIGVSWTDSFLPKEKENSRKEK
jgi:hypothetical protein